MGIMSDINTFWFGNPPKKPQNKSGNLAECIRRDDEEQARKKAQREYKLEPVSILLDRKLVKK